MGPDHVPFVGQTPLLCGGAAASMLLRFWGERHVHGDDFAPLVRADEGGIATTDLEAAIRDRGYETLVVTGEPAVVFSALAKGVPSMLLLEGNPTLHYVVLVRADPSHVWIHDPNFGPDRRLTRSRLMDLWQESGLWALVATPRTGDSDPETAPTARYREDTARPGATWTAAIRALRADDHRQARTLAGEMLENGVEEASLARRIIATSYHLEGRGEEALVHWNALGEPTLDLLEIRGPDHTRYHALAARAGIDVGELVTPGALNLARRRIGEVPAVRGVRVAYTPHPDGSADVETFVDERRRIPGWTDVGSAIVSSLTDGGAGLEAGPFIAAGDRWRVSATWKDAQSIRSVSVATTSDHLPGVLSLEVDWRRERYAARTTGAPVLARERTRRSLGFREWVGPSLAVDLGLASERWESERNQFAASVGGIWALPGEDVRARAHIEHWRGDLTPFTRLSLDLRARRDLGSRVAVGLTAGVASASDAAPRPVWPGAGIGEVRLPLLRGHPLVADGVVAGAAFGRELVHATGEVRIQERYGPIRYGVAGFVDFARVSGTGTPSSPSRFLDPGVGLFIDTGDREFRIDAARGDSAWTVSAGVRPSS